MRFPAFVLPLAAAAFAAAACSPAAPAPVAAPGAAAPPAASAGEGTVYGAPLAEVRSVTLTDLLARAEELEGKPVRVEATVVDVCSKRGCWIKLGDDATPETVTFKVTDGVMVFPMSARGKHAVADGTVQRLKLSLDQTRQVLQHEAEEAGKEFDPATVTAPMTMVRLAGIGARIRDSR